MGAAIPLTAAETPSSENGNTPPEALSVELARLFPEIAITIPGAALPGEPVSAAIEVMEVLPGPRTNITGTSMYCGMALGD